MPERTEKLNVPTHFSVAIIAECGGIDFEDAKILMVRNRLGKWGPPAGKINLLADNRLENPIDALKREWSEELDGFPFDFKRVRLSDNLFYSTTEGANVGFIFKGRLKEMYIPDLKRGISVDNDESINHARLLKFEEIVEILENWETRLVHPELNGHTLIKWCNELMSEYNNLYFNGLQESFSQSDFGMSFPILSMQSLTMDV